MKFIQNFLHSLLSIIYTQDSMTLHQTVVFFHKTVKWSAIIGGTGFTIYMLFTIGNFFYGVFYPPPPILPDVKFGKLIPLPFPESTIKESFNYSIDTLTGELPQFADRVKVYKIVQNKISLFNVQNSREKAAAIGFREEINNQFRELEITTSKYQWQVVSNNLLRTLIMDTNTYDFKLSSAYRTYAGINNMTSTRSVENAKVMVNTLLNKMEYSTEDIDETKTKVRLLQLKNGVLIPADSLDTTQIMRVDFFQKDVDEIPIYYNEHPFSALYFFTLASGSNEDSVLEGSYMHQRLSEEVGEYPIKTAAEAFEELKAGRAFISNYYGTSLSIPITDVRLGYYIGNTRQEYIVPIIVFQSKDNFFAFVSAIKDSCFTTSTLSLEECQGMPKENKK